MTQVVIMASGVKAESIAAVLKLKANEPGCRNPLNLNIWVLKNFPTDQGTQVTMLCACPGPFVEFENDGGFSL